MSFVMSTALVLRRYSLLWLFGCVCLFVCVCEFVVGGGMVGMTMCVNKDDNGGGGLMGARTMYQMASKGLRDRRMKRSKPSMPPALRQRAVEEGKGGVRERAVELR